jgi:hypothetical protein
MSSPAGRGRSCSSTGGSGGGPRTHFASGGRWRELGHPLDGVISSLAGNEDSFEPLAQFAEELKGRAVSPYAYEKGKAFMDGIAPGGRSKRGTRAED